MNNFLRMAVFVLTFVLLPQIINAATHYVTTSADNGTGSLRQIVANSNSGDTIRFNVASVNLTGSDIDISKNLTIIGGAGDNKVTIKAGSRRIFYVNANYKFIISNLILTGANFSIAGVNGCGGAVFINYATFTATNCEFINNSVNVGNTYDMYGGGAVYMYMGTFTANNCIFSNNNTDMRGGAVNINYGTFTANNCIFFNNKGNVSGAINLCNKNATFIATDCVFSNNTSGQYGSVVDMNDGTFISTNCTFKNNTCTSYFNGSSVCVDHGIFVVSNSTFSGNNGGNTIYLHSIGSAYLYHCTIDKNETMHPFISSSSGGIGGQGGNIYIYNCILTGNVLTDNLNQIGTGVSILSNGRNMIEGQNGATRDLVFGNNVLTGNYITPLLYAKSATQLTASDIQVPSGIVITANDIITKLSTDQIGENRIPDICNFVTYGAIEVLGVRMEINSITFRWDSVLNVVPGDTISLLASIESINRPIIFDSISFNIGMDYKLFQPMKLFVIKGNTEYPINFDFSFATGISASIGYHELKSGATFLRLEGRALLSKPIFTDVRFDRFDFIPSLQCSDLTFRKGFLDVSKFCGSEWRGGIIFLPEYEVYLENIVTENALKLGFTATGKLEIEISIIDLDGTIVHSQKHILSEGNTTKELKLNALASGKYFIRFSNPFYPTITKQFVIAK